MWPQACPAPVSLLTISLNGDDVCANPGRASNSPSIPIIGPPLLYSAVNADGIPANPLLTTKPSSS